LPFEYIKKGEQAELLLIQKTKIKKSIQSISTTLRNLTIKNKYKHKQKTKRIMDSSDCCQPKNCYVAYRTE